MPDESSPLLATAHGNTWKWWICGLLLMATMINYMDRVTLNQTSKRIKDELHLSNEQYGELEQAFGVAFALGAVAIGWAVDRWNAQWMYAAAVILWSMAGFATGFAIGLASLMMCRFFLGLFEAGNWPCALRTTQRILLPHERTLGNSILQSGAAVGAFVTPLIVQVLVSGPGTWRYPFFVVGAVGTLWVIFWLASVRRRDLALSTAPKDMLFSRPADAEEGWPVLRILGDRRFWILILLTVSINQTWHFLRVWLPLYLREGRCYPESTVNYFISAYYLATDAGSLTAGFAALGLARLGVPVHWSRVLVFLACAGLVTLTALAAFLPPGPMLLGLLLIVGFGALGVFPAYYSLSQEITMRHQGKVTGMLGFSTWMASAVMHPFVGRWIDHTNDWPLAVSLAGLPPLVACLVLIVAWPAARSLAPLLRDRTPVPEGGLRPAADGMARQAVAPKPVG